MNRCWRSVLAAVAVLAVGPLLAVPAQAATAYRYWSYWSGTSSSWVYSNTGPSAGVRDGDVIGWRFGVQEDSSNAHAPRASATSLCSNGVTVVIDYGTSADAPPGEQPPSTSARAFCAEKADSNTGYRATGEHASLRVRDDGLVCGIDGYPKNECAAVVSAPSASPTATRSTTPARARVHTRAAVRMPAATTTRPTTTQTALPGRVTSVAPRAVASPVARPTPSPTLLVTTSAPGDNRDGGGAPVSLIAGVTIAALVGGAAFWRYRAGQR